MREVDEGQYDYVAEILGAKGAAMTVKREVLEEVGLFDEDYFALREETDLCWRVWLRGYKVIFIPTSIVYHVAGFLSKSNNDSFTRWWGNNQLFYWYRNWLITLIKNLELKNLLRIVSFFLAISLVDTLISSMKSKSVRPLKSFLKATSYVVLDLKRVLHKRVYVQRVIKRKRDDEILPHFTVRVSPLEKLRRRSKLNEFQRFQAFQNNA